MASSSSTVRSPSSEDENRPIIDERKRKRMLSNRESARRSRMRKQKRVDDLTAQISQLTNENRQIMNSLNVTTNLYMNMDAENLILKAQLSELNNRLQSLNEIVEFVDSCNSEIGINIGSITDHNQNEGCGFDNRMTGGHVDGDYDDLLTVMNPWGGSAFGNQPIMANDMILF